MLKLFRDKLSSSLYLPTAATRIFGRLDIHTLEVVKKSFSSTIVKVAGMVIGLAVSVFLGRTLGADGLGIIDLTHRIVNILLIVGLLGLQQVIVKEVAIAHNKKDFEHIANVMHTAYWLNGGISLVLSVLLILLSPWLSDKVFHEPRLTYPLMIALVVIAPQVFSRIFSSGLIGYRKIWQSNLVDQTLSISVTGFFLLFFWLLKQEITLNLVATIYAFGRIIVTISIGFYWKSLNSFKSKKVKIPKQLLVTAIPIFWASIATIVVSNADVIMLGWLSNTKEIGLYTVASRIALITSFFLQVTNAAISPKIAALYEAGKIKELEKMVQRVTKGLLFIGIIQLIVFIIGGKIILNIWGAEFVNSYKILVILGIGQLFNIGTGAVGLLLIMCGFEKIQSKIAIIFMFINLLLNFILINLFGAIGAAISTATTITIINIIKTFYVKKKIGLSTIKYLSF